MEIRINWQSPTHQMIGMKILKALGYECYRYKRMKHTSTIIKCESESFFETELNPYLTKAINEFNQRSNEIANEIVDFAVAVIEAEKEELPPLNLEAATGVVTWNDIR